MAKTTHAMVLERFDDAITKRVAELTAAANTKRANELASMATAEG
jgi:hypothetical protein